MGKWMRMNYFSRFFITFLWGLSVILSPKGFSEEGVKLYLDAEEVSHFMRDRSGKLNSLSVRDKTVMTFPKSETFFWRTSYLDQNEGEFAFTQKPLGLASSEKNELGQGMKGGQFVGLGNAHSDWDILLDGRGFVISLTKEGTPFIKSSLIVDQIRAASDSRGEPTIRENSILQHRIRQLFHEKRPKEITFTSLIEIPANFHDSDQSQFFVTSNLKGFPLMTLRCSDPQKAGCRLERQCFLSGKTKVPEEGVYGVGVHPDKKWVLLGSRQYNRVMVYRYSSCFHLREVGLMHLPDHFGPITGIYVDDKERLYILTQEKDLKLGATLFIWPKEAWLLP